MNPVLLFTDTERIEDEQSTLSNVVELFQSVYTAIKAVGVTPTINEIYTLVGSAKKQDTSDFVKNYVTNKLVAAVSPYVVNGVTFTDQAVRGFIKVPDTSGILAALQPVWGGNSQNIFEGDAKGVETGLLTLANDVISAVVDANAQLAAKYTYYTKNDASATVATALQVVCDALNTFDESNNNFFMMKTPPSENRQSGEGRGTVIPGLDIRENAFVVSLPFMRKFEQIGSLDFVRNS